MHSRRPCHRACICHHNNTNNHTFSLHCWQLSNKASIPLFSFCSKRDRPFAKCTKDAIKPSSPTVTMRPPCCRIEPLIYWLQGFRIQRYCPSCPSRSQAPGACGGRERRFPHEPPAATDAPSKQSRRGFLFAHCPSLASRALCIFFCLNVLVPDSSASPLIPLELFNTADASFDTSRANPVSRVTSRRQQQTTTRMLMPSASRSDSSLHYGRQHGMMMMGNPCDDRYVSWTCTAFSHCRTRY